MKSTKEITDAIEKVNAILLAAELPFYSEIAQAIGDLGEFAATSRARYAETKEWTSRADGSCETIRVPVALLNRIRDLVNEVKPAA